MPIDSEQLGAAAGHIADRWAMLVVAGVLEQPRTFSELESTVAGIAPNILTSRLRQLERDGLIVSVPYSSRPPRVRYGATAAGRDLAEVLGVLAEWGARRAGLPAARRHQACGTPLERRSWCPTCDIALDDVGVNDVVWI